MTALEYMKKQVEQRKVDLHRAIAKKASEEEISAIKQKIGYYSLAVEALREKGAEYERQTD